MAIYNHHSFSDWKTSCCLACLKWLIWGLWFSRIPVIVTLFWYSWYFVITWESVVSTYMRCFTISVQCCYWSCCCVLMLFPIVVHALTTSVNWASVRTGPHSIPPVMMLDLIDLKNLNWNEKENPVFREAHGNWQSYKGALKNWEIQNCQMNVMTKYSLLSREQRGWGCSSMSLSWKFGCRIWTFV